MRIFDKYKKYKKEVTQLRFEKSKLIQENYHLKNECETLKKQLDQSKNM